MTTTIDQGRLEQFMGQAVNDMGAAITAAMIVVGDKLGLYRAMAGAGPLTVGEVARRAGTAERYTREWLLNQAASGILEYDAGRATFSLPPEQALALADEDSEVFIPGAFQVIASVFKDYERLCNAFQTGEGIPWGDHSACLFEGTERFFRPGYRAHLIKSWIPAIDGLETRLREGARVADIGCGHGASTILLAQAYPNSTFRGFDNHQESIVAATAAAEKAGVSDRVKFAAANAVDFPGEDYDFVACFDCLHDMGDPIGCATRVREALRPDGVWMIVEPYAGDSPEENLNPVGRVYYGASTAVCVPASLAYDGPALGAQAGEKRLSEMIKRGGFSRVRRAAETPFNLVLEARP